MTLEGSSLYTTLATTLGRTSFWPIKSSWVQFYKSMDFEFESWFICEGWRYFVGKASPFFYKSTTVNRLQVPSIHIIMLVISHNNIVITTRPIRNRTLRKVVYTFPVVPLKLYEQYLYSKILEHKMNLPPAGFKQYDKMVFQLFRFSIRECLAT